LHRSGEPRTRAQNRSSVAYLPPTAVSGSQARPSEIGASFSSNYSRWMLILTAFTPEQFGFDGWVDDEVLAPFPAAAQQISVGKLILIEPDSELLHL
jgi:hypothetical protein